MDKQIMIQTILKQVNNVISISCSQLPNCEKDINTPYYCVYTTTPGEKNEIIYIQGRAVRVISLDLIINTTFPKDLGIAESFFYLIYNKYDILNYNQEKKDMLLRTFLPDIINLMKQTPSHIYNAASIRFRHILFNYLQTGILTTNIPEEEFRLHERIEFHESFSQLNKNSAAEMIFKQTLLKILECDGGQNMDVLEKETILNVLLQIKAGKTPPLTPIANEELVIPAANFINQLFPASDANFEKSVKTLGIDIFCSAETLKNIVNLSVNFLSQDGKIYLDKLIATNINGPLCRQSTESLCIDYILQNGLLDEYSDYANTVINPAELITDSRGQYPEWRFFSL